MIRRLAFASLTSLCVLAPAPRAIAAEHAIAGSIVRVYVAGPPEAIARTQAALRELLARIELEAVVEPASDESVLASTVPDTAPRAFLDFRSTAAPRVVLVDRPSGKELERRTLPASTSLEVAVEEAAHVLYMALESSQHAHTDDTAAAAGTSSSAGSPPSGSGTAGGEAAPRGGTASNPVQPAAPPAASTSGAPPAGRSHVGPANDSRPTEAARAARLADGAPAARRRTAVPLEAGLSAFGGFSSFEAEHVLPGIGGALDMGLGKSPLRAAAWLSVGAFFPSAVTLGAQSGSIRAEAFRLAALAEWFVVPRASFVLGGGGGVDHVSFDAGASAAAVQSGAVARTDPILEALGGMRLRISSGLGAFALAALDVDLTPHRYVTETGGQATAFFALPRARPAAYAGLTYVFYDAAAAASTRERSP